MKKTNKGFSLVELIIVMAMLAALMGISSISFSSAWRARASKAASTSNAMAITQQTTAMMRFVFALPAVSELAAFGAYFGVSLLVFFADSTLVIVFLTVFLGVSFVLFSAIKGTSYSEFGYIILFSGKNSTIFRILFLTQIQNKFIIYLTGENKHPR